MTWQVMNTGFGPAAWNMEFDERLAERAGSGDDLSILRLYGWKPHAISIGRNQSMDDFDLESMRQAGLDIVRRPTGGRAILHAEELTYCVVTSCRDHSPREIYHWINKGLLEGLRFLGIRAQMTDASPDFNELYRQPASVACFSGSAKSEIQFEGKKLIGSAQRRYGSVVLQHGSLLLDSHHLDIVKFLSPLFSDSRSLIEDRLSQHTIDARSILGRPLSFEEAADGMIRGCALAWDIPFSAVEDPTISVASASTI